MDHSEERKTPDGILFQEQEDGMLAIDRAVKVEWENLDEGLSGDFDPEDSQDINLLRFTVYLEKDGNWEQVDDASYCTNMPVDTPKPILKKALLYLLKEYSNVLNSDSCQSVKKLGEELSWISPEWFQEDVHG